MNQRPCLLIVDDESVFIQLFYQIFRESYEVYMATGGAQALELVRGKLKPDLILLDVMMPDMDGHDVCRQLKADPQTADIPVIFVTAQLDPVDETNALEVGGVDFITKPVNPAVVKARVKTHVTLKAQADLLKRMAFLDGLTGVANRRRFDEALATEWRACRRTGVPLTLLMIDIDQFKKYNDFYGHQAGDHCLQTVANTMKQQLVRAHDTLARYGGEEFACLLPDCGSEAGMIKAEALRAAIENLQLPHAAADAHKIVTISVGLATVYPHHEEGQQALLADADKALYQAKTDGRNRIYHALTPAALSPNALTAVRD